MTATTHPIKPTPGSVLAELEQQHAEIRALMDHCEDLADQLDIGQLEIEELTRELARLRLALDSHNQFEERLIRPVLESEDAFAEVRIDRMVADHAGEHRAITTRLETAETRHLRETLGMLRSHLEDEERYLLNAKVLHDDLVSLEADG